MAVAKTLPITNERGLHARASAKFVETVEKFSAQVTVSREGMQVTGDSIMGLLMLGAGKGTEIEVHCDGEDAEDVAAALETLVTGKFGEGA